MDNGRFLSDETKITVRMPEGIDARAYEFSQTSGLHHFFGEYTIHKYKYDQKTVQDLEKFIADFDGSEYSYLARMGLAFMWLRGVEGTQDQARAIELLTQVADKAGDPLSSAAEYHLGKIRFAGGTSMLERQKKNHPSELPVSKSPGRNTNPVLQIPGGRSPSSALTRGFGLATLSHTEIKIL